ncbi:MAG: hypothetical protein ACREJM_02690, partial [Candidatus Saccharimonadales bacterium]
LFTDFKSGNRQESDMDAFEHWELEEQLRHAARVLGPDFLQRRGEQRVAAAGHHASWTDWLAMAVGLCAFVVGGVLSISDLWGQHQQMWKFGLAVALLGQAALAVGLWQPHHAISPQDACGGGSHHRLRQTPHRQ